MTVFLQRLLFQSNARKISFYYCIYSFLFLLFYLAIVSTIAFFHFLLDHEMGIIESWLNRNAWEVLILSKTLALFISLKSLMLNNYSFSNFKSFLKDSFKLPHQKVIVFVLYIFTFMYALLNQFGAEFIRTPDEFSFSIASYIGSIVFFTCDALFIFYCLYHKSLSRRQGFLLQAILPFIFFLTTKIALPYVDKYFIFVFLHFITMNIIIFKYKSNISNILIYAFVVIGPLSSLLGIDLVWDNSYALYSFPKTTPFVGIMILWLSALVYFVRKN